MQVYNTGERVHIPKPLKMVDVHSEYSDFRYDTEATIYKVQAKLGASVVVTDSDRFNIGWETLLKSKIYRPLAEEIFGEFRQPLLEADLAIMQGDSKKASELIGTVLNSMFKV